MSAGNPSIAASIVSSEGRTPGRSRIGLRREFPASRCRWARVVSSRRSARATASST
ncbi:hypothetical protein ACFQQE_00185 [Glycomyces mayteni]|uniref:hypothetical protein n=1 Tax=Glycomyces mayteni TaxID=543887 RepID=UPI0036119469